MGQATGFNKKTALVLDGALAPAALGDFMARVKKANGPLAAAKLLTEARPDLLVARADVPWQRSLVAGLPARRPAVMLVGVPSAAEASQADEWVAPTVSGAELASRIEVALWRGAEKRRAARRVFVDALTGLPNRRAIVRALVQDASRARRTGGSVCLVLLDLDDFKQVNETLGHPEGDRVLRKVGAALRRTVRGDELCGRIGGDEFAFVVAGHEDDADALVERMMNALRGCGVSASAAACELGPAERLRDLYRRTDELLKQRKQLSRARRQLPAAPSGPGPGGDSSADLDALAH